MIALPFPAACLATCSIPLTCGYGQTWPMSPGAATIAGQLAPGSAKRCLSRRGIPAFASRPSPYSSAIAAAHRAGQLGSSPWAASSVLPGGDRRCKARRSRPRSGLALRCRSTSGSPSGDGRGEDPSRPATTDKPQPRPWSFPTGAVPEASAFPLRSFRRLPAQRGPRRRRGADYPAACRGALAVRHLGMASRKIKWPPRPNSGLGSPKPPQARTDQLPCRRSRSVWLRLGNTCPLEVLNHEIMGHGEL